MAVNKRSLANLKPIKKGEVRNKTGSNMNPAIRALKNLTIETYREVIELALTSNIDALKSIATDPNTPAVQVGVATALMKAIQAGDWTVIEQIAARIVGKIPDELKVHSTNNTRVALVDEVKMREAMKKIEEDV